MESVILVRLNNGNVIAIGEGLEIETFPDQDAAIEFANGHALCQAMPYQVVELDEL